MGDVDLLERFYAAACPAQPSRIACPPLPTCRDLATQHVQRLLADRLFASVRPHADDSPDLTRWHLAFWKLVVTRTEQGIELRKADGTLDQDFEVDERILEHYTTLQSRALASSQVRSYHYGPLRDRKSWKRVRLKEDVASIGQGTTGLRSWGASVQLANHLLAHPDLVAGRTVLELGSGCGLVAVTAAQLLQTSLGSKGNVLATDANPTVLERLADNVARNELVGAVRIAELDWTAVDDAASSAKELVMGTQLVLAADVTYDPVVIPSLVNTLAFVLGTCPHATAILAATIRNADTWRLFTETCTERGLVTHPLELDELPDNAGIVGGHDEEETSGAVVRAVRVERAPWMQ